MNVRFEDDPLGDAIASVEAPRPRETLRTGLRSALLATAASEWTPRPRPTPRPAFAFGPRLVPIAAVLLVVAALGTTGAAATSSLPGDTAYPVKQALEQAELALATDDAARVEVLARQSDRRLDELNRVAEQRPETAPTASASYQETVQKFQAAVDALRSAPADEKHERALDVADAAVSKHVEVLESVKEKTGAPGLERALERAKDLKQKVEKDKKDQEDRREEDRRGPSQSPRPASSPSRR